MYGRREENIGDYVVLYKRDVKTEKRKKYGERMLYDYKKEFGDLASARTYATEHLPAIVFKKGTEIAQEEVKDLTKPYVVVAQHHGKYSSSCMGETDPMRTYDAIRVEGSELEEKIESMASEDHVEKILAGVELKALPYVDYLAQNNGTLEITR